MRVVWPDGSWSSSNAYWSFAAISGPILPLVDAHRMSAALNGFILKSRPALVAGLKRVSAVELSGHWDG
jgi:hypothetical protein